MGKNEYYILNWVGDRKMVGKKNGGSTMKMVARRKAI